MNPIDLKNISSAFSQPRIMGSRPSLNNFNKPMMSPKATSRPTNYVAQLYQNARPAKPAPVAKQVEKGFSLPDFAKSKVIKDNSIYKSDFRNKTRNALKGTLGRFEDRNTVANILWDRRGNGLNIGEVKGKFNEAIKKGTLRPDQVRAVRRKMGM